MAASAPGACHGWRIDREEILAVEDLDGRPAQELGEQDRQQETVRERTGSTAIYPCRLRNGENRHTSSVLGARSRSSPPSTPTPANSAIDRYSRWTIAGIEIRTPEIEPGHVAAQHPGQQAALEAEVGGRISVRDDPHCDAGAEAGRERQGELHPLHQRALLFEEHALESADADQDAGHATRLPPPSPAASPRDLFPACQAATIIMLVIRPRIRASHGLLRLSVKLQKVAEADFPSRFGHFRIYGFEGHYPSGVEEAVVLRMGELSGRSAARPNPFAVPHRRRVSTACAATAARNSSSRSTRSAKKGAGC